MKWLNLVSPENYLAAETYLTLKLNQSKAEKAVDHLRAAPVITLRVNDILRASGYTPLSKKDPGVKQELEAETTNAVLLVSYDFGDDIADGFHRICAAYTIDPFMEIPAKITYIWDKEN
jgi:hypothetical protein